MEELLRELGVEEAVLGSWALVDEGRLTFEM